MTVSSVTFRFTSRTARGRPCWFVWRFRLGCVLIRQNSCIITWNKRIRWWKVLTQMSNKSVEYNYDNRSFFLQSAQGRWMFNSKLMLLRIFASRISENNIQGVNKVPLHLTFQQININNWASRDVNMTKKGVYGASGIFIYFPQLGGN